MHCKQPNKQITIFMFFHLVLPVAFITHVSLCNFIMMLKKQPKALRLCAQNSLELIYSIFAHSYPDVYECGLKVTAVVRLHLNLTAFSFILFHFIFWYFFRNIHHRTMWKLSSFHVQCFFHSVARENRRENKNKILTKMKWMLQLVLKWKRRGKCLR